MKVQVVVCDKCGKPIQKGDCVQTRITINDYKKDVDMHNSCLRQLISMVEIATMVPRRVDSESTIESIEQVKEVKKTTAKSKTVDSTVRGPMTAREKKRIAEMYNSGKSINEISVETGRTIKTISKVVDSCKTVTAEQNNSTVEENVITTSMLITIKNRNSATVNGKRADLGMLRALINTGWKHKDIALDMHLDEEEVAELERVYRLWLKNPNCTITLSK